MRREFIVVIFDRCGFNSQRESDDIVKFLKGLESERSQSATIEFRQKHPASIAFWRGEAEIDAPFFIGVSAL